MVHKNGSMRGLYIALKEISINQQGFHVIFFRVPWIFCLQRSEKVSCSCWKGDVVTHGNEHDSLMFIKLFDSLSLSSGYTPEN